MLLATACNPAIASESEFQGAWGNELDGYAIVVRDGHVCGSWSYVATNRGYEGYFAGTAINGRLTIQRICGTPGGSASKWCPGQLEGTRTEETGWDQPSDRKTGQICHGHLVFYDKDAATSQRCKPDMTGGYPRATARERSKQMRELARAIKKIPGLADCLPR